MKNDVIWMQMDQFVIDYILYFLNVDFAFLVVMRLSNLHVIKVKTLGFW